METLQSHLLPFATDLARAGIWFLLLAVILVPLEKLSALHPVKVFRKSFLVDLEYYFLNSLGSKALLVLPTAVIAGTLRYVVPSGLHVWVGAMPLWGRLAGALAVGEFGFYWGHRWTHEIPLLWRFHAVHHSAEEMDWLVNARSHPFDFVFVRLCGFVPMYALGLAQPAAGMKLDPVPLLVLLTVSVWGYFIHANVRWRFGWLGMLIATPAFHHWHHTNDEHVDKNYASMLPIMDIVFGSWYMPKKKWPPKYGIDAPIPRGLAAQLVQPLLARGEEASVPTAQTAG